MKIIFWLFSIVAMLSGCKHEEPAPILNPTTLIMLVVNENREPLDKIKVIIGGSSGSYFGGTRKDTLFATRYTNSYGKIAFEAVFDVEWRVYAQPVGFPDYDILRFEGTTDAIVKTGQANNITVIMKKQ